MGSLNSIMLKQNVSIDVIEFLRVLRYKYEVPPSLHRCIFCTLKSCPSIFAVHLYTNSSSSISKKRKRKQSKIVFHFGYGTEVRNATGRLTWVKRYRAGLKIGSRNEDAFDIWCNHNVTSYPVLIHKYTYVFIYIFLCVGINNNKKEYRKIKQ